jgi:hypothetical protein
MDGQTPEVLGTVIRYVRTTEQEVHVKKTEPTDNQLEEELVSEAEMVLGICPYFKRDRGGGVVVCESARFRFPDKLSRREIVYRFCGHPDGYKLCPLKQALDHYYERKYAHEASDQTA